MSRTLVSILTLLVVSGLAVVPAVGAAGSAPVYDHDGSGETVDCSFPITATDATGTEVTIEEEPDRLTVLGPSTAQTVWAIGAQEKVVGMSVNPFTSYLEGSESKTNVVGPRGQPNIESVVGTEPDLVLAPNITSPDAVQSLRDAGLTVYTFELAGSLDDVNTKTRQIGRLVGSFGSAADVSATTHARIEAVREAVSGAERPTAYYVFAGPGSFTAGPETFIGDVIDSAGAENIAAEAGIQRYGEISQEVLAANTVDWLVLPGQVQPPVNPAINESRAVAEGNLVRVDSNFISQPGPRVTQPLAAMAQAFHPEAMDGVDVSSIEADSSIQCAANAEPTADEETTEVVMTPNGATTTADGDTDDATTTAMAGEETTTAEAGDTSDGSGPGFTAVAALVAVLAAALLARRRS
jgi:iron complex transport system substrate-binding protein